MGNIITHGSEIFVDDVMKPSYGELSLILNRWVNRISMYRVQFLLETLLSLKYRPKKQTNNKTKKKLTQ